MCDQPKSTIAQILFTDHSDLNFAHVVGELERSLDGAVGQDHSLTWDCDDVAVFDLVGTRIVLSLADTRGISVPDPVYSACLTISVGTVPGMNEITPLSRRHEGLCSVIADRVRSYYAAEAILWQELPLSMTPEMIDDLVDELPSPASRSAVAATEDTEPAQPVWQETDTDLTDIEDAELPQPVSQDGESAQPTSKKAALVLKFRKPVRSALRPQKKQAPADLTADFAVDFAADTPVEVANSLPDLPGTDQFRLTRVRDALYALPEGAEVEAPPTTQIRLAAHAVNATLIVVYLPLGAALMTYSLLRGEDMRMSAQAVALTGLFMGIAQSPLAQQITHLI